MAFDTHGYTNKPQKEEIAGISKRVVHVEQKELEELIDLIGKKGCSFLPAFMNGSRKKENFVSMQWFVLDFDGGVYFDEIFQRSIQNSLRISFAYHTFQSVEKEERFRVVFIHEAPVTDRRIAEMMLDMMLRVFPEADRSCSDVSRMFFGGKEVIYKDLTASFHFSDLKDAFVRAIDTGDNLRRNVRAFGCRLALLQYTG